MSKFGRLDDFSNFDEGNEEDWALSISGDIPISEEKLDAILENSQVQDLLKGFLKDEVVDGTYRILLKKFQKSKLAKRKKFPLSRHDVEELIEMKFLGVLILCAVKSAVNEDILFFDAIDEVIEEEELQYTIQEGLQYEIDLLEEEWNN